MGDDSCGLFCLSKPQFRSPPFVALGATIWLIGTLGNFYHHWLLPRLRSDSNAANQFKYKVPRGGLFWYVCCPHYLMELIGCSVIVLAFGDVTGLCILWVM